MANNSWGFTIFCGLALATTGWAQAEKPSPFLEKRGLDQPPKERQEFVENARRDFIRGGHVNVGIVFGPGRSRDRDAPRGPDVYPDRHPERGCGECEYESHGDEWYREEAKRRAEWEREEAKRYYEHQREADKRYYEQQHEAKKRHHEMRREERKRRREHEREAHKRQQEHEREFAKAAGEAERERFEHRRAPQRF